MKTTSLYLFTTTALMMIYISVGASITKKSDVKLDSNGLCLESASWMEDCNQCFCPENGVPACTLMNCVHLQLLEMQDIQIKDDTGGAKDGKCEPGTRWTEDCNSCFCTEDGVGACTEIGCVQLVKD